MKKEETVDHHIKTAWHAISRMYNQEAVQYDITTSIGFVLLNINSELGTPATKIAPSMGLESRSLTRMLKSMEDKELIYKLPDKTDKRSVRIYLTPMGNIKKEIARKTVLTFNYFVQENITQDKLDVFFEVIKKINILIENNNIYNSPKNRKSKK